MLLLRYLAATYFLYCHGQFVLAIPISEVLNCPWEDAVTMINKMSLPGSRSNTILAQNTKKVSRARRDHPKQFEKRFYMYERRDFEVEIHYHCLTSGRGSERFGWTVVWDSDYPDIQYYAITNIGGFPDEDKTWDDDTYPAPFTGSWWWHDQEEFLINRHMCKRSYTGHFEGQVDSRGISIFLINAPTDPLKPEIFEHCRGRSSDASRSPQQCSRWTVSSHCQFLYSTVLRPASSPR